MRVFVTALFVLSTSAAAFGQTAGQDKPFQPVSGQAGKDVVWVPSPPEMVNKLMDLGNVTPSDFVIDLGSGDGRNVIAAAKRGARALGVEYNPDMVSLSQRLAQEAGVADKAQFVQHDMYEYDISKATVMALFLLPVNMNKLAPKFFNLAPGSRIVANTFGIDGWEPDERVTLPASSECESWCEALLWVVPAKVAGTWAVGNQSMTLTQEYQMVQGTVTAGGVSTPIAMGRLRGNELTFNVDGATYKGTVSADGKTITGAITTATGSTPWSATKQ
ncbi:MAG TPA: methyltransferase domain-containing protein [Vicinamibacterales bacterium]|nr:methyltransferase domain-containing protein [Vicinamibacterales bacterium]